MSSVPADVVPLNALQTQSLHSAVSGLSPEQLQWVSGYAAGLAAAGGEIAAFATASNVATAPATDSGEKLTVLYGSQTGNGEEIAQQLADQAKASGFAARVISLADYKPSHLKRESLVTFVVSTHGEGDPPDDAEIFHEFLLSKKAPKLGGLKYSVLALGDSSYVNFCQTGREFDTRLAELGAERFRPLVECDLDFDESVSVWSGAIVGELPELLGSVAGAMPAPVLRAVEGPSAPVTSPYGKANPFPAEILVNQKITGGRSSKDVRHVELTLEGSGLSYEPGDSLAVVIANPPQLVDELIRELDLNADSIVAVKQQNIKLIDALSEHLEVTAVNLGFLREWSALANNEHLSSMLQEENKELLTEFVDSHQIIDVVTQFPASVDADQFIGMLRQLSPRSYSISSSMQANPDEVHITVAAVRYTAFERDHWGAASTHIADRVAEGETVGVYIEKNKRFRLPADDVPVIMIGPGTGVAPFRAFLEERVEKGASGKNWLVFGDRNADSDFLYQLEWQRYLKQGHLHRLDVAFSRDQRQKVYVQDRLRESGAELIRWLDDGATIYVCGDAKHMAGDVHDALLDVFIQHGGLDLESANHRLKELRTAGRYQRDVY